MAEELQLNIGDIVQLKSGGPKMTLISKSGAFSKCQFFDKNDTLHAKDFLTETLKKIEPPKPVEPPRF